MPFAQDLTKEQGHVQNKELSLEMTTKANRKVKTVRAANFASVLVPIPGGPLTGSKRKRRRL